MEDDGGREDVQENEDEQKNPVASHASSPADGFLQAVSHSEDG